MVDDLALRRALIQYVRATLGPYSIGETLYRLTDLSVEVLGCDGAGVSVIDGAGDLRFVSATDEFIVPAEQRQIAAREGPCQQTFATSTAVRVVDLQAERERWPDYSRAALDAGCRAVMSVSIDVGEGSIGALDLYRRQIHEWTDQELAAAELLADMAAGYIANLRTLSNSKRLSEQLQHALDSRIVIEQAKGVIAERRTIGVREAFQLLRGTARHHRRPIHDVARDVVDQRLEI